MAVAHDAVSESHTGTTGVASVASFTWNHVPTGSPRSALVFTLALGANPVTGVTYGGVAMTAVPYTAYDSDTEPGFLQAWFLDNCATGTQAVVVNRTNNAVVTYAVCVTQTAAAACEVYLAGVKTIAAAGTEQTAASSSATGVASAWSSMTLDDGSPGTNSIRYLAVYSGASSVPTAGANTSSLSSPGYIDFGTLVFQSFVETAASQGAKALNVGVAISDDLAVIGLAIREAPAGGTTTPVTLTATSTFTVSIAKPATYRITATATPTFAAVLARSVGITLKAVQGFVALIPGKVIGKTLTATPTFSPTVAKVVPRNITLTATPTFSASMTNGLVFMRTMTATSTFAPALTVSRAFLVTMTATVTMTASLTRRVALTLRATPVLAVSLARRVAMTMLVNELMAPSLADAALHRIALTATSPFVASETPTFIPGGGPGPEPTPTGHHNAALVQKRQ